MGKAIRAQVDAPVPREDLKKPGEKAQIRIELYREMRKLGVVDEPTIRYVMDPPDGPLQERFGLPNDDTAVIRMTAFVAPRD